MTAAEWLIRRYHAARELERARQHMREATLTDRQRVAHAWKQWQVTP